jgi:DNA uptake protein ComE-like DNA-binding protein
MSFYRTLLAAIAAVVIATPVFAEDATSVPAESTASVPAESAATAPSTENGNAQASIAAEENGVATEAKVNLNKATAKDLMKVKGINASKARALVACRKKQKPDHVFKSVADISKCKGYTKMKADDLKSIQDQLTVE